MNIPAFHAAAQTPQLAETMPSSSLPREAAERAPEARPVIEASEPSLTRRDLPRGSLIDIVA